MRTLRTAALLGAIGIGLPLAPAAAQLTYIPPPIDLAPGGSACEMTTDVFPLPGLDIMVAVRIPRNFTIDFPGMPVNVTDLPCPGGWGDPHLTTVDGHRYDLQAAGEFVALESMDDDFVVQVRMEPYGASDRVSLQTAVATRVGGSRVTITVADDVPLRIDGERVELSPDRAALVGDGLVLLDDRQYVIVYPDGTNLRVTTRRASMTIHVLLPQGRYGAVRGLYGDGDGDPDNDFTTRDGITTVPDRPDFDALYGTFAESWRVRPEESLFDYGPGESTATFTDRSHPTAPAGVAQLSEDARRRAEDACRRAGVTAAPELEACIIDVGFTADTMFAHAAADAQRARPAALGGATLEAADRVPAGSAVEVAWTGPDDQQDYVTIVTPDAPLGEYGDYTRTHNGSPLEITVPDSAGVFELRYVHQDTRRVLARRPIVAEPISATLDAPERALAGSAVEVRWTGPDNVQDYITIVPPDVPPDAPLGEYGDYTRTHNGSPLEITVPDSAGTFELRYVSQQSDRVLARRPITLEPISATLDAPERAPAGSAVEVRWTGPDNVQDYITIVPPDVPADAPLGEYGDHARTHNGSPLSITAPDEPGIYEVRYISQQSRRVLARERIVVEQEGTR